MHRYRIIVFCSGVLLFSHCSADSEAIPKWRELLIQSEHLEKSRQFDSSKSLALAGLAEAKATFGEADSSAALALHRLGTICFALGQVDSSLIYWLQSRSIWKKLGDINYLSLAKTLNNLGSAYGNRFFDNQLLGATYYDSALQIKLKYLAPDDPSFAATYTNLSTYYTTMLHDVVTGEKYARMALAIRLKENPPNADKLLLARWKVGEALFAMQRYDSALQIYNDIRQEQLARGDTASFIGLSANAAYCHTVLGHYVTADSLYRILLSMSQKSGVEPYFAYQNLLGLGRALRRMGSTDSAMVYLQRALAMEQSPKGVATDERWMLRYELGMAFLQGRKIDSAASWLTMALDMCERIYGKFHNEPARVLSQLAMTYRAQGEFNTSLQFLDSSYHIYYAIALEQMSGMIEEDALRYQRTLKTVRDLYVSCLSDAPSPSEELKWRAAELLSFAKGLTSDLVAARRRIARSAHQPHLDSLRRNLAILRSERSHLAFRNADSLKSSVDSVSLLIEAYEEQVAYDLHSDLKTYATANRSLKEFCVYIPDSAIVVDYQVVTASDTYGVLIEPHLLAVILRRNTAPEIVHVGPMAPIDTIIREYAAHMDAVAHLAHYPTNALFSAYLKIGSQLYDRLITPFAPILKQSKVVIISPDGSLNNISFAGLVDSDGVFLAESESLQYINSIHDLMIPRKTMSIHQVLAVGDPDFKRVRTTPNASSHDMSTGQAIALLRGVPDSCMNVSFYAVEALPGTRLEIEQTRKSWQREGVRVISLMGAEASEERVRNDLPGCQIAHIATHGYWLTGQCASEMHDGTTAEISPLLSSGLLLAGAQAESNTQPSNDDGILTADDILDMDLPNTQVVVLSTCESGLGEIVTGEGVYGLRRAFDMAGVTTVVSSLWKISDQATADLFAGLYPKSDKSFAESIQQIQRECIAKLRRQGLPPHPFLWASFIATGTQ